MVDIDPYHYSLPYKLNESVDDGKDAAFIRNFINTHNKIDTIIPVGNTGYPYGYKHLKEIGWTYDELGRVFMVTEDRYRFQRYTGSGRIVNLGDINRTPYVHQPMFIPDRK